MVVLILLFVVGGPALGVWTLWHDMPPEPAPTADPLTRLEHQDHARLLAWAVPPLALLSAAAGLGLVLRPGLGTRNLAIATLWIVALGAYLVALHVQSFRESLPVAALLDGHGLFQLFKTALFAVVWTRYLTSSDRARALFENG